MAAQYIYSLPDSISFTGKGLLGYAFGPLNQRDLEIYQIEVETGHDVFMISKKIIRTYYVLSGNGYFTIANRRYDVSPGTVVEVPPKVEYCYSGKMKLLAFSKPRWFAGNDIFTRWNPDVIRGDVTYRPETQSWLTRLVRIRLFGKAPVGTFLRLNARLWNKLPTSFTGTSPLRQYGVFLNTLARARDVRAQAFGTFFLRNRPELELIRCLVERSPETDSLKIAVLGCSTGAEAYSVAWTIRSQRPELKLIMRAVDISKHAVAAGKRGEYSLVSSQLAATDLLERMTAAEIGEMFDRDGDVVKVKPWIREGIEWSVGDAEDPEIRDELGFQDIVLANNFLCGMDAPAAEQCLRNIAQLVRPGGHLFVAGIDLEVRTKVAEDLGWRPLQELLEEIHDGDPSMRRIWPCQYSALEPLNTRRRDWKLRYAAVFQLGTVSESRALTRETVQAA